jgi:hypothetical protein
MEHTPSSFTKKNAPTDSEKSLLQDDLFSGVVAVCTWLGQGMNLLPLRGGLPSHFVFSNGGLVAKHLMIAKSARLRFSAPNERRAAHSAAEIRPPFALLIQFFTLFWRHRCRTTDDDEYHH